VPGSFSADSGLEDYCNYHCLHYQHAGDSAKVHETLKQWIERRGRRKGNGLQGRIFGAGPIMRGSVLIKSTVWTGFRYRQQKIRIVGKG
jgi:hypothetical protein